MRARAVTDRINTYRPTVLRARRITIAHALAVNFQWYPVERNILAPTTAAYLPEQSSALTAPGVEDSGRPTSIKSDNLQASELQTSASLRVWDSMIFFIKRCLVALLKQLDGPAVKLAQFHYRIFEYHFCNLIKSLPRKYCLIFLLGASSFFSSPASAQNAVSSLAITLSEMGAFSCTEKANAVALFLFGDSLVTLIADRPESAPNQSLLRVTGILEPQTVAGLNPLSAIIELTFAPGLATGCQASYQATTVFAEECSAVAALIYQNVSFGQVGQLGSRYGFLSRNARVTMTPAGQGCTTTKSEIIR